MFLWLYFLVFVCAQVLATPVMNLKKNEEEGKTNNILIS